MRNWKLIRLNADTENGIVALRGSGAALPTSHGLSRGRRLHAVSETRRAFTRHILQAVSGCSTCARRVVEINLRDTGGHHADSAHHQQARRVDVRHARRRHQHAAAVGRPEVLGRRVHGLREGLAVRRGCAAARARDLRGLRGHVAGAALGPVHRPDQCAAEARRVAVVAADGVERDRDRRRRGRACRRAQAAARREPPEVRDRRTGSHAARHGLVDELHLWVFP